MSRHSYRSLPVLITFVFLLSTGISVWAFSDTEAPSAAGSVPGLENGSEELYSSDGAFREDLSCPDAEPAERITLRYDDRCDLDGEIETIRTLSVDSCQPGTDIPDSTVISIEDDTNGRVRALGCGRAQVWLRDGRKYEITVEAAPLSLVLFAGQSNGEGRPMDIDELGEYKQQWVLCEEGQVYSSYAPSDEYGQDMYYEVAWYEDLEQVGALTEGNASRFIPASLSRNEQNDIYNRTDRLTAADGAPGKGGPDSSFGYRWHQLTGEKIWIINACHHGSNIQSWNPGHERCRNYREALALAKEALKLLDKECRAGHYTLRHRGVIWCQGENNLSSSPLTYMRALLQVRDGLFEALTGNSEGGSGDSAAAEFFGIIMVRAAAQDPLSEKDFRLNGPRMAQYMAASSSKKPFRTIFMASHVSDQWVTDEDVRRYFSEKYGSEEAYRAAYPTPASWIPMPSDRAMLHGGIHFSQLAYNEIGMDAAENICYALGYAEAPAGVSMRVEMLGEDGIYDRNGLEISDEGGSLTFAVRVHPAYMTKDIRLVYSPNVICKKGIPFRSAPGDIEILAEADTVVAGRLTCICS